LRFETKDRALMGNNNGTGKSLESWIWDAACSIRGAKDAPKYKDYIEYLIRKFAEGGGQSAGEFFTPPELGTIMSRVLQPEPGMEIYDPTCDSGSLLVKCEIAMEQSAKGKKRTVAPLKLFGQEFTPETWAMANMNMIIHGMEGQIEIVEELNAIELAARETDAALRGILKQLGLGP
jgi:type I restriction-modification system DNA methylase subunit